MINYSVDADGIALVEWDMPQRSQNVINEDSTRAWIEAMDKAIAEPRVRGILIGSGKKDFLAGGDLSMLQGLKRPQDVLARAERLHAATRRFERCGKPIACAMPGSALGGGLEIALATHYRVAAGNPKARFGLPEVTLGLLPGGGGTQRLPRLIGYAAAIALMTEGKKVGATEALHLGLLHQVVSQGSERQAARAWLLSAAALNPGQPWDSKGARIPGGALDSAQGGLFFMAANARLREKTFNNYPAPKHILSCVYEGLATDIDTGLRIEARYFAACVASPQAKNMIRSLFFGVGQANKLATRPQGVPVQAYTRIGMLGAGMMGSGIAMATAAAGIEVVLLDTSLEAVNKGKQYAIRQWAKQVDKGRLSQQQASQMAARILPVADYAELAGCELVIEAVFERRDIKADVTRKAEAVLAPTAIFATNTSTLPITGLAQASVRPAGFIGLHFFSPAEKMPLVEIIMGQGTSSDTLARAMDYVRAIGKTPIVVNDARGFYTSRVFGTYMAEGMALLQEGVTPALIEKAGVMAGMPVGPLAVADEVSLELIHKIRLQTQADLADAYVAGPADAVCALMAQAQGRLGRKSGAGFYDYPEGSPKRLWPGLAQHFPPRPESGQPGVDEVIERLIMVQSAETARCLEEGVLRAPIDAEVGAILGWAYPAFRGGPLGWLDTLGIVRAVADLERLAQRHGPRFAPNKLLRDMAAQDKSFFAG